MYCAKCGNTGFLLNGKVCDCRKSITDVYTDVSCFDIPEQYRDVMFNESLVLPMNGSGAYAAKLQSIHELVSALDWKSKNLLLCSPARHSKTIMAYSCIRRLFKGGIPVCPIYDLLELKQMFTSFDRGSGSPDEVNAFIHAPYAFVRIPPTLNADVFNVAALVLDRRTRHGNSTIFLFNGSYEQISKADVFGNFTSYAGDGSYCSFEVSSWKEARSSEG